MPGMYSFYGLYLMASVKKWLLVVRGRSETLGPGRAQERRVVTC